MLWVGSDSYGRTTGMRRHRPSAASKIGAFPNGAAKRYSLDDVKRPLEGRHGSSWVQTMVDIEPGAYLEGDDVADRRRHGKDVAPCLR